MDLCITHVVYLEAIKFYLVNGGRSRGSYIVADSEAAEKTTGPESLSGFELCKYDREIENRILQVALTEGIVRFSSEEVREIPEQNLWFEKVWKDYLQDNFSDC
jgi:hypothetical protein